MTDFDQFWAAYPRKIAKLDAMKAYSKARVVATAEEILVGVEAYKRNKPDYADWCHPATFLNKGRWLDEYDAPVIIPATPHWFDECKVLHGGQCEKRWDHEMKKREGAA